MRRLLARIPRDRTLLLLIAPVVALGAILGASALDRGPTPATVRTSTSTTVAERDRGSDEVASGAEGGAPAGTPAPSGGEAGPDLSAGGNSDYQGDPAADVGGGDLGAPGDFGPVEGADAPAPEVLGATTVPVSPTTTVRSAPSTTVPSTSVPSTTVPGTTVPTTVPSTTVPSSTSTTMPGTTTTTVPGPPPVVSESPVAALIPVSAVVAVGLALGLLYRRRRRGDDTR